MRYGCVLALLLAAAPAWAEAPRWQVDAPASRLGFAAEMAGVGFEGRFGTWTADIRFDPDTLKDTKITVRIDMASARTGDADRDGALPGREWFDVARHPVAVFAARKVTRVSDGRYVAHGALTLRGVTRRIDLPFTLTQKDGTAQMQSALVLDRTQFGVGQGQWQSNDPVKTQVTVTVRLTASRLP